MTEFGCGVKYKFCNHYSGDCADENRTMIGAHTTIECGVYMVSLPDCGKGFIAGTRGQWGILYPRWFCSVECYQKIPENKKIKFENF